MHTYSEKKTSIGKSVAEEVSQLKKGYDVPVSLVDIRPEVIAQRKYGEFGNTDSGKMGIGYSSLKLLPSTTVLEPGSVPVVQLLMNRNQFTGSFPGPISPGATPFVAAINHTLDLFHNETPPLIPYPWKSLAVRRQEFSDRRLSQLDLIEHSIYSWLDQNRATAPGGGERAAFEALMNDVQDAHRTQIDYIHNHNLTLWTPDRSTLGVAAAGQLDNDWDALRNQTGNIQITDTSPGIGPGVAAHQHGQFQSEMRAIHARLLSRPQGRALMNQLLAGAGALGAGGGAAGHQVSIQPYHPMAIAMGISGAEANAEHLPSAHANIDGGAAYVGPSGANSASLVGMEAGMTDSANTNADAMGVGANQIASPAFVIYAHEMIHALHNMQGTNRRNVTPALYGAGGAHHGWTNEEERETISVGAGGGPTENAIRAEHGLLTPRVGH